MPAGVRETSARSRLGTRSVTASARHRNRSWWPTYLRWRAGVGAAAGGQVPVQEERRKWGRRHGDPRQWDPGSRYAWGDLESSRGRRGGARADLVRQCGGRPGGPARAHVPGHPDGRGGRGRRGGRPGAAPGRLHADARGQRPRRPVRAAPRLGRGAHHDRGTRSGCRPHRAADLLVRPHQRGEGRSARRQRQRLHRRRGGHQAVADQRRRRGRAAPRRSARRCPRRARRTPDGRRAAGRQRRRDADLRAAAAGADPRPLGRRHARRPRPARAARGRRPVPHPPPRRRRGS